jgi:hypothetical protein
MREMTNFDPKSKKRVNKEIKREGRKLKSTQEGRQPPKRGNTHSNLMRDSIILRAHSRGKTILDGSGGQFHQMRFKHYISINLNWSSRFLHLLHTDNCRIMLGDVPPSTFP